MNELEKGLNNLGLEYETDGKKYKIPTHKENLVKLLKSYMILASDLQDRIDKATEYIEKNSFDKEEYGKCWFKCFKFKADTQGIAQDLLNILQGKSDE